MKNCLIYLCILFCVENLCFSQSHVSTIFNQWIDEQGVLTETDNVQDLIIEYDQINFTIHDIYTPKSWELFFFLTRSELQQINLYLSKHRTEKSVLFLNQLSNFPKEKAYLIYNKTQENLLTVNSNSLSILSVYSQSDLRKAEFKQRNRFLYKYETFLLSIQTEQDNGEENLRDFVSGGLSFSKKNTSWYLGDFTAKFGLGLSLFQGFQSTSNRGFFSQGQQGFQIHRGSHENAYFRGIAVNHKHKKNHEFYGFVSSKQTDGREDELLITSIFTGGLHLTNSDHIFKNNIQINSYGLGYEFDYKAINTSIILHHHKFDKLLQSYSFNYLKQNSLSNLVQIYGSKYYGAIEIALDQYKYLSVLSKFSYQLGNSVYLHINYGRENQNMKNYFRSIPTDFSNPELFFGYQLELDKKRVNMRFSYQYSELSDHLELSKDKTTVQFITRYKTSRKNILQFGVQFRKNRKDLLIDDEKPLIRSFVRYTSSKRGLWKWSQELQCKSIVDKGLGYRQQLNYIHYPIQLRLGFVVYTQDSGAFYFYESDIPSYGYQRGYYENGLIGFIQVQYQIADYSAYFKIRIKKSNKDQSNGLSFGLRYKI